MAIGFARQAPATARAEPGAAIFSLFLNKSPYSHMEFLVMHAKRAAEILNPEYQEEFHQSDLYTFL